MSDDEFLQIELRAQEAMNELFDACEEQDLHFNSRGEDIIYNAEHQE